MKKAVIYVRVSTMEQTQGLSLRVQEESCRKYCETQGWEVVQVFEDAGESAKTADRPAFQEMIRHCTRNKKSIHAAVVYKLDRFSRSTEDAAVCTSLLARAGTTLLSSTEPVSNDPSGQLMRHMLSAMAEFDNSMRAERSRACMVRLVQNGYWVHAAPLGMRNSRDPEGRPILEPDPPAAEHMAKAFRLVALEGYSQAEALRHLREIGLKTQGGAALQAQSFNKLLRNPLYCGRLIAKQTEGRAIKAVFPGLISEDLFDRAQVALDGRSPLPAPRNQTHPDFPLRSLLVCTGCGKPLTAAYARNNKGRRYGYYYCPTRDCRKVKARKELMEEQFAQLLQEVSLESACAMRLLKDILADRWAEEHRESLATQTAATATANQLEKRKKLLLEKLLAGTIPDELYKATVLEIESELTLLRIKRKDAEVSEAELAALLELAEQLTRNMRGIWERTQDVNDRQRLQGILFPNGVGCDEKGLNRTLVNSSLAELCLLLDTQESKVAPPRFSDWKPVAALFQRLKDVRDLGKRAA